MRELLYQRCVTKARVRFSGTPVDNSAWVEIEDSLSQAVNAAEIMNTSSAVLLIAAGAMGSEQEKAYYILPAGHSILVPLEFSKADRISVKCASDVDADDGELHINFFG